MTPSRPPKPLFYTVADFAQARGISEASVHRALHRARLRGWKAGSIPKPDSGPGNVVRWSVDRKDVRTYLTSKTTTDA